MTLLSPLAAAIAELATDEAFAALTTRIRPFEPQGAVDGDTGDVRAPGSYVRYAIVLYGDAPEDPSLPIADVTLYIRFYGLTFPDAEALYLAGMAVFRRKGPRIAANGVAIYRSSAVGGPTIDKDPSNQQPYAVGIVNLTATTQAVAA